MVKAISFKDLFWYLKDIMMICFWEFHYRLYPERKFFYQFSFIDGETSTALLVQNRLLVLKDLSKRLEK